MMRFFLKLTFVLVLVAAAGVAYFAINAMGGLDKAANDLRIYVAGRLAGPGGKAEEGSGRLSATLATGTTTAAGVDRPEVLEQADATKRALTTAANQQAAEAVLMSTAAQAFKEKAKTEEAVTAEAKAKAAQLAVARQQAVVIAAAAAHAGRDAQDAAKTLAEAQRGKEQALGALKEEVVAARALGSTGSTHLSRPGTVVNSAKAGPNVVSDWQQPALALGIGIVGLGAAGWFISRMATKRAAVRVGLRSRGPIDAENSFMLQGKGEVICVDSCGLPSWSARGPARDALALGCGSNGAVEVIQAAAGWKLDDKPATAGASVHVGTRLSHESGALLELTDIVSVGSAAVRAETVAG